MQHIENLRTLARNTRRIALLTAGLVVVGCADTAGPGVDTGELPIANGSMHRHLQWATPPSASQFQARAVLPDGEVDLVPHAMPQVLADGVWYEWDRKDVFSVSFYAVRGQEREINVTVDTPSGTVKFLELEITEPTQRPDGSPIAVGDSVLITVTIDPQNLAVDLQPSGIRFGSTYRTELELSYALADPDYNGDGRVNGKDGYIEDNLLGVWMQEGPNHPWEFIPGIHRPAVKEFEVFLEHFSGYAVSW